MNNYQLYENVLSAINEDEGAFNVAARNWIAVVDKAPFEDEKANELFGQAKMFQSIWRSGAINSRVSKRRMIARIREIAEMQLPNPYDPDEKDPESIETEEKNEKTYVFGVVEKPTEEETYEAVEEKSIPPEVKKEEKPAEEPKEEKRLFGKKKNR